MQHSPSWGGKHVEAVNLEPRPRSLALPRAHSPSERGLSEEPRGRQASAGSPALHPCRRGAAEPGGFRGRIPALAPR